MIGKTVKLRPTPIGLPTSGNSYLTSCEEFKITGVYNTNSGYEGYLISKKNDCSAGSAGWVYKHELLLSFTKEELNESIKEKLQRVEAINNEILLETEKIKWLETTGNKEFNEDEFKVYQTLILLENESLSLMEKSKLISQLIKH